MNPAEPPSSIWNCLSCRRRKVRCDRRSPCTPCTKAGIDCAFPVSGRLPTRRDDQGTATAGSRDKKQADLLARLKRLEGVLRDLGVEPDGSISTGSVNGESSSARTVESHQFEVEERMMVQNLGSMVVSEDETVYIPSKFWKHITEEVSTLRQSFEFVDEFQFTGPGEETSNFANQGLPWAPFCPHTSSDFNPDDYQPLPSQMAFIWQTYCENVDHAVKILHRPCMEKVIRESKGRFSSLSTSMQALLFSISIASIASMSEQDVQENFRDSRTALLRRLSTGAEACLSKSDVLNTTDVRLLQAFVLYIEAKSQEAGNRASWCLTGLAVRIALLMGLHRDGSHFSNIPPFDVEIRRRLWWHVCLLDSRSEEAQTACTQMSVFGILHDTDFPTNVDDGDLDPQMASLAVAREGITDSSLFIARCQLWHLAKSSKRHGPPTGNDQAPAADLPPKAPPGFDALNASRAKLEDTFFRHLRQDDPRHVFFADVVRHSLAVFELNSYLHQVPPTRNPPAGVSCPGVNRTFVLSLAVLELSHSLESCPETSGCYWGLRPPVPWRTISALLVHSHKRPWSPTCERAWACITSYMATSPAFRANCKKDVLWIPVRKLLAEAAAYRALENQRIQGQPEIARRLRILKTAEQSSPDWTRAPCHRSTFDLDEAEKRLELEMQVAAADFSSPLPSAEGEDLFSLPVVSSSQANSMTVPDFSTGLGTDSLSAGDMGWEDLLPDGGFLDSAEAWDAWDQMMAH